MKMKYLYCTLLLLAGISSCTYPYDPDISSETERTLIVDGEILVGGMSTIRLNYLTDLDELNTNLRHPQGKAWIEDREGNRYEAADSYLTATIRIPTINAVAGREYRAVIEVDGLTYSSEWVMANPAPVINNIWFDANDKTVFVYVDVDAGESHTGYMGFSYEETWEFHADYIPEYIIDPNSWSYSLLMGTWPYYWCYRTLESQQMTLLDYSTLDGRRTRKYPILNFPRTDSRNHQRYSILVKAYSLSRDTYLYNKRTQELSEVGGDLFSPEPGMMVGNVSCETDPERQAFGLVLAAQVTEKRAFMDGRYLKLERQDDSFMIAPDPTDPDQLPLFYYNMNYRPIKTTVIDDQQVIGWGPHRCINCLEAGGTQERPSFWNDGN